MEDPTRWGTVYFINVCSNCGFTFSFSGTCRNAHHDVIYKISDKIKSVFPVVVFRVFVGRKLTVPVALLPVLLGTNIVNLNNIKGQLPRLPSLYFTCFFYLESFKVSFHVAPQTRNASTSCFIAVLVYIWISAWNYALIKWPPESICHWSFYLTRVNLINSSFFFRTTSLGLYLQFLGMCSSASRWPFRCVAPSSLQTKPVSYKRLCIIVVLLVWVVSSQGSVSIASGQSFVIMCSKQHCHEISYVFLS